MKQWLALFLFLLLLTPSRLHAQELDPAKMLKPPTDTWPTFNGDYTGRRFSPLAQINKDNVGSLTLAWAFQAHTQGLQAMPLEVNGILYVAGGNQIWAVDARTGRQVWHFARPGVAVSGGNKGVAMWHDRLFLTTLRRAASLPRRQRRKNDLAGSDRRSCAQSLRWRGAARDSRSHHRRHLRRHRRSSRLSRIVRSDDRKNRVALGRHAQDGRRGCVEYLAARYRRRHAWRRHDLDHRHIRSAAQSALLGHRQSASG